MIRSRKPRVHVLQHVPFEGLGTIQPFFIKRELEFDMTHLYQEHSLPALEEFDLLVIMGGPMGVNDVKEYPWLVAEKQFIASAISAGKRLLGICLGAQLIAAALGAKVLPMGYREIGWFDVESSDECPSPIRQIFGDNFECFHWHGDTFEIPKDSLSIGSSKACANQGFLYGDKVLGLQFHLEFSTPSVQRLVTNCAHELDGGDWVQSAEEMLASPVRFDAGHKKIDVLLDYLLSEN